MYSRLKFRYEITPEAGARFIAFLCRAAILIDPVILEPIIHASPDEDTVFYTVSDGQAKILCTLNSKYFGLPEVIEFCKSRVIRVVSNIEILRVLVR